MTTQVTVTLADDIYRRAERLAELTERPIADLLAETIDLSLRPLGPEGAAGQPVAALSNADLRTAADARMDATEDRRFSELLDKQQAGLLTDADRVSLLALMQIYQDGLLHKAKALNEAVRRGLRPPLEP